MPHGSGAVFKDGDARLMPRLESGSADFWNSQGSSWLSDSSPCQK